MTTKNTIQAHMGHRFTDALYDGTTEHTLQVPFIEALEEIAQAAQAGYVTRWQAAEIMTRHNPMDEYNVRRFFAALPAIMDHLQPGMVSIVCTAHPEWGTWGIVQDHGDYYTIRGDRGHTTLFKNEAEVYWRAV